jgi:hypothetical protein
MRGRRFLTRTDRLIADRRDPDALDQVRMLIRATEENFTSWTVSYHLEDEEPGEVHVHVRDPEHPNLTRLLAEVFEARFGVDAEYTDDRVTVNRHDLTGF